MKSFAFVVVIVLFIIFGVYVYIFNQELKDPESIFGIIILFLLIVKVILSSKALYDESRKS
jgi:putative effector of murein hydrolase LrgA (UPF0299 family)